MKYRYISFLRIPEHLYCAVVYGHKAKDDPQWMKAEGETDQFLVETCFRCGAQRVLDKVAVDSLVQLA